jgi:poly(hydroxyalkanoate) depolymerase family esterase
MSLRSNGSPRPLASRLARLWAAPAAICAGLLFAAPARAASLTQVTAAWNGGNTEPSYITMYEYIPNTVATNPPILVVVHYCGGSASGIFGEAQGGGIISKADSEGFIMVFPQLNGRNCWDVATTASLTHGMGGDTGAIVDMVKYEIKTRNANANRVYSIGSSSGAMMTEALLAVYPDVFKGGAEFAGVPAGCWSVSYTSSNQWSGPCAGGMVTHTAADWGTMVRNMYPGYNGFRPRIQLWHGTADTTISPVNQTEAIKQWTNVLGLPTNPTTTTTVTIGSGSYMRQQWTDASCGVTLLDAWTENNGPHGTDANMNGQYSLPFMNLDKTPFAATDPQTACGSSGTGGSSGTAGSTGSGTAGTSGTAGRGGTTGTAGTNGSGTAGTTGTTGTAGRGGTGGTGGNNNNTSGTAGNSASGTAGNSGSSGTTGTGSGTAGNSASGVAGNGSGEAGTTGTSTGTAGNGSTGTAGNSSPGTAGDNGSTGNGGTSGVTTVQPGCACNVTRSSGALDAFALAGMITVVFRRRRAKRSADKR